AAETATWCCALGSGSTEWRVWRWSGLGWTVSPCAPAASAMRPSPVTLGHGRSRRLRSIAMALRLTESLAGMVRTSAFRDRLYTGFGHAMQRISADPAESAASPDDGQAFGRPRDRGVEPALARILEGPALVE